MLLIRCQKLSEAFNYHFASICSKLSNRIHSNVDSRAYFESLTCYENRAKSKAKGLDEISARFLRVCPDLIAESLA